MEALNDHARKADSTLRRVCWLIKRRDDLASLRHRCGVRREDGIAEINLPKHYSNFDRFLNHWATMIREVMDVWSFDRDDA